MPSNVARKEFNVTLTYFKPGGKYYSAGECVIEAKSITMGEGTPREYTIAYTYDLIDAVKAMPEHPGLSGRWDGPILISGPEVSPPHLITAGAAVPTDDSAALRAMLDKAIGERDAARELARSFKNGSADLIDVQAAGDWLYEDDEDEDCDDPDSEEPDEPTDDPDSGPLDDPNPQAT